MLVDECVVQFIDSKVDYLSNTNPPTFPDGLDTEVFTVAALRRAARESKNSFDHEHVTPYLRCQELFKTSSIAHHEDLSGLRWTVDELVDFEVVSNVLQILPPKSIFLGQVLQLHQNHPELFAANQNIVRNEGALMGKAKNCGNAKQVIPSGNMLLSKRPEMFLPEQWPAYFSKAKGCKVWDLDGNEYIDMSIMGIGTNTLGYGHPEVDDAVLRTLQAGNMSTLNCPEEVYLAEKLIELHPWANMVRFARSGGEANAIAIRIARAASGKDKLQFVVTMGGMIGIANNLGNEQSLDGHLLPASNQMAYHVI